MPTTDPVAARLQKVPVAPSVRADAWDAYYHASDLDDLTKRLSALPLPTDVKADLWDLASQQHAGPSAKASASSGGVHPIESAVKFGRGVWNAVASIPESAVNLVADSVIRRDDDGSIHYPFEDTVRAMGRAQGELAAQARDAYRSGDYLRAGIKGAEYLLPVVGPMMGAAGDKMERGDIAEASGELATNAALTAAGFRPKAPPSMRRPVLGTPSNPVEAAAVNFAKREGVPLDAGTATGSTFIKNVQKKVASSYGGAQTAERLQAAQAEALAKVGNQLAEATGAPPTTPLAAGESVRRNLTNQIQLLHEQATTNYDRLRQLEQQAPEEVVPARPVAAAPPVRVAGDVTPERAFILRWLADDLREMNYQPASRMRGEHALDAESARAYGDTADTYAPRVAGTPTQKMFHALGITGSRADIAGKLERALAQASAGKAYNPKVFHLADAMSQAWDGTRFDFDLVSDDTLLKLGARRRDLQSPISTPLRYDDPGASAFFPDRASNVPESAATAPTAAAGLERQRLAVPLAPTKPLLRQILEPLLRKSELTKQLMGGEGRAAVALDALVNGPDFAPLSVVDSALSDIKAMARGADMPELRTGGQARAAQVVRILDQQVRARAAQAGPDVLRALEQGRAATKQKFVVADTLDMLSQEPRQVFQQLTQNKDVGVERLRAVARLAPEELPNLSRGVLEDMLQQATAEGGFTHADRLYANWQKLGGETKRMLFPKKGQIADLDQFFLLAKRIKENPNPSGTAQVMNATNLSLGIPSWALAKLLMTPQGVRALTAVRVARGAGTPVAARTLALTNLAKAAQSADVPLDVIPVFADGSAATTPERRR